MNIFNDFKSFILTFILTIILGWYLGLAISSTIDNRLKNATIHMPKPKNNITVKILKKKPKNISVDIKDNSNKIEDFLNYKTKLPKKKNYQTIKQNLKINSIKKNKQTNNKKNNKSEDISILKNKQTNNKKNNKSEDISILKNDKKISKKNSKKIYLDKNILLYNNYYKKNIDKNKKINKTTDIYIPANAEKIDSETQKIDSNMKYINDNSFTHWRSKIS